MGMERVLKVQLWRWKGGKGGAFLTWLSVFLGPLAAYTLFLISQDVNPLSIYQEMLRGSFGDWYGFGEVTIRAAPFILTGLATAVPARAGLVNVGGEGQLFLGALAATAAGVYLLPGFPGWAGIPLLMLAGAAGGALWGFIPGILRARFKMNETITTLLLNYVAAFTVGFFVNGIMKDPASFNWPFSAPLPGALRLSPIGDSRMNIGFFVAVGLAIAVWYILGRTRSGFRMKVVGGNARAAGQAGISVSKIQLAALVAAGALAGIAGAIEIAGVEGNLRPSTGAGYGYLGFLAAWMAWNRPLWLVATSLLLGVLSVSGISLELTSGLASSSVNILIAFILVAVLSAGRKVKA
jgi:ABC-type uncharacterized transport system permease subunit